MSARPGVTTQPWRLSWRADPTARAMADRHYSRQTHGSPQFVPPGRCLVLTTAHALWVTSWPRFAMHEWAGAWVCTLFRNEGPELSSTLIAAAVAATRWQWPDAPHGGMVTFVDPMEGRAAALGGGEPMSRPLPVARSGWCHARAEAWSHQRCWKPGCPCACHDIPEEKPMTVTTRRPWPEAQMPTPEQWRDWFLACTPDEQLELAARTVRNGHEALACFVGDHANLGRELHHSQEALAQVLRRERRYRLAWASARRRGQQLRRVQAYVDDYLAGRLA